MKPRSTSKLNNFTGTPTIALAITALGILITTSDAQSSPPAASPGHQHSSSANASATPPDALSQQIADLQNKMAKLEAVIASHSQQSSSPGGMKMGGSGGAQMAGSPASGMSGGGMGMMKMMGGGGMMNMMGEMMGGGMSGGSSAIAQSALPGFPGASHLYHIGSTGFFLDHPEHISLSTDQQVALNKIKEQALASKNATERQIEQAEQELATLTSADQPDSGKIEAKVREIEKLRANERLGFIRAVGDAAKLLTDDQRKILTGFASPAPAASPAPSATMTPMSHM